MSFDPLIERFVVIGVDVSLDSSINYGKVLDDEVHPTFLNIYPFDNQEGPSYLDNFKLWGFPDGFSIYNEHCLKVNGTRSQQPEATAAAATAVPKTQPASSIQSKNTLHHFILSNENAEKKYCSTLLIHEEVYVSSDDTKHQQFSSAPSSFLPLSISQNKNNQTNTSSSPHIKLYIPKLICVISSSPVLEFQKQYLAFLYKFTIATKLTKQPARLTVYEGLYDRFSSLCQLHPSFAAAEKAWDDSEYVKTLSIIKEDTTNLQKNTFKLKEEYLINFAVSLLFRLHTLALPLHRNSINDSSDTNAANTFETIFTLSNEEVCRIRPTTQSGSSISSFFQLHNFSFRPLFEKISIHTLLSFLTAILLEKQIIIVSAQPNEIISICEAVFTLIYPLKWSCLYIPLLPLALADIAQALQPYVLGFSRATFNALQHTLDLTDKVLLDLDNDSISQLSQPAPLLPSYLSVFLSSNLKRLSNKLTTSRMPNNENQDKTIAGGAPIASLTQDTWFSTMFDLKTVFLNFMVSLINNFSPFLLFSDNTDPQKVSANKVFAANEFLSIFDTDETPFMTEFSSQTMMFSKFIEEVYSYLYHTDFNPSSATHLIEETISNSSLNVFIRQSKNLLNSMCRKEKKFESILNPLIYSSLNIEIEQHHVIALKQFLNPIRVDLTSHLIKYLKFIESAPVPPSFNFPPNSPMYLSNSKILFPILHKDWLMPIPPKDSRKLGLKLKDQSSRSPQYQPLDIVAAEDEQKPNPIKLFYRKHLEYDTCEKRQFMLDFDQLHMNYPVKQRIHVKTTSAHQYRQSYNQSSVEIIFLRDALFRLLQQAENKVALAATAYVAATAAESSRPTQSRKIFHETNQMNKTKSIYRPTTTTVYANRNSTNNNDAYQKQQQSAYFLPSQNDLDSQHQSTNMFDNKRRVYHHSSSTNLQSTNNRSNQQQRISHNRSSDQLPVSANPVQYYSTNTQTNQQIISTRSERQFNYNSNNNNKIKNNDDNQCSITQRYFQPTKNTVKQQKRPNIFAANQRQFIDTKRQKSVEMKENSSIQVQSTTQRVHNEQKKEQPRLPQRELANPKHAVASYTRHNKNGASKSPNNTYRPIFF